MQKSCKKIWYFKKTPYLCNPERNVRRNAEIAQLVERNLAKVEVAGPSPVFRSKPQHIAEVFLYALLSPTSRDLNLSPEGTAPLAPGGNVTLQTSQSEVAGPSPVFRSKPQHIAEVFLYALLSPYFPRTPFYQKKARDFQGKSLAKTHKK